MIIEPHRVFSSPKLKEYLNFSPSQTNLYKLNLGQFHHIFKRREGTLQSQSSLFIIREGDLHHYT